jgi:hypothetical protein
MPPFKGAFLPGSTTTPSRHKLCAYLGASALNRICRIPTGIDQVT